MKRRSDRLARPLCLRPTTTKQQNNVLRVDEGGIGLLPTKTQSGNEPAEAMDKTEHQLDDTTKGNDENKEEWVLTALVVDRICLILYSLAFVIGIIYYLMIACGRT